LFHFSYKRDYYISSCWAEPSKPERPTIAVGKWIYPKSRKKYYRQLALYHWPIWGWKSQLPPDINPNQFTR